MRERKNRPRVREAIERIVTYLWDDEEQDYLSQPPEGQTEHIFISLRQVKFWLNRQAARRNEHDYFGHCPRCGGNDGYFNIGRAHFFHCRLCRTKWFAGENLFSLWRQEMESEWDANAAKFAGYEEVEPVCGTTGESFNAAVPLLEDAVVSKAWSRRTLWLAGLVIVVAFLCLPELIVFVETCGHGEPLFGKGG